MPDHLYFTADLRSAIVSLPADPPPPAVVWLRLPGEGKAVPAWLLTPETYGRIWWGVANCENACQLGEYPRAKLDIIYERWRPVWQHAKAHFDAAEQDKACGRAMMGNLHGGLPPLPEPPPLPPGPEPDWDAAGYRWCAERGAWERV